MFSEHAPLVPTVMVPRRLKQVHAGVGHSNSGQPVVGSLPHNGASQRHAFARFDQSSCTS